MQVKKLTVMNTEPFHHLFSLLFLAGFLHLIFIGFIVSSLLCLTFASEELSCFKIKCFTYVLYDCLPNW